MLRPWSKLRGHSPARTFGELLDRLGDSNADIPDTPPPARGGPGGRLRPGPRPDASTDHHLCDNGSGLPLRRPGGSRRRGAGSREFVYEGISGSQTRDHGTFPRRSWRAGCSDEITRRLCVWAHLGDHPESVGFPANHPPMESFLGAPIMMRGKGVRKHLPDREAGTGRVHPGRRGHSRSPRHRRPVSLWKTPDCSSSHELVKDGSPQHLPSARGCWPVTRSRTACKLLASRVSGPDRRRPT